MYVYVKQMKNREELLKKEDMPVLIKRVMRFIFATFNIATIEKIDKEHLLIIVPKVNDKKIKKIKLQYKKDKIIFSKLLKQYQEKYEKEKIINEFLEEILDFIIEKTENENIKVEMQNIYFLANEYNKKYIDIIEKILQKTKTINIVTRNLKKYMEYEEKLYDEKGILISVTNNRRKSLKNAKIIINIDFKEEELKQYSINRNCIFINCTGEKYKSIKYFDGTIINGIEVCANEIERLKEIELYQDFENTDIYVGFENESENVRIKNLIGNNGKISKKELQNLQKILDKC
mgnify:FL=1